MTVTGDAKNVGARDRVGEHAVQARPRTALVAPEEHAELEPVTPELLLMVLSMLRLRIGARWLTCDHVVALAQPLARHRRDALQQWIRLRVG
mgnify:CR=1 FL=1